jgi:PAS domain S-box-containing protein
MSENPNGSAIAAAAPHLTALILDSMTSGILLVDLENRILFLNSALAERLGADRETCLGESPETLFRSDFAATPARERPLYRARNQGSAQSREVRWSEGKRVVHLREDSSPLLDSSGNVMGRLFAYHDLSWEKTVDQMKSEFISIASHELRTPMTSIKGSVDLILGGRFGEISADARELLDIAKSACDRMIRLINDILDLSKIEAGQIKLNLTPMSLGDVAERSMRTLGPLALQRGIRLELDQAGDIPPVLADKDRVEQIVTNLLSNAIKFSPEEGEVRVEISSTGEWAYCSVSDQGCGIREEDQDRIFGKFQQVGGHHREKGTGLGLAITHALVTEHRGKIWIESSLGKGTRFFFTLPIARNDSTGSNEKQTQADIRID